MNRKLLLGGLTVLIVVIALFGAFYVRTRPASVPDDGVADPDAITIMPTASEVPEAQDAPLPEPVLSFAEDAENPLPTLDKPHLLGDSAKLRGTVSSNLPITAVRITITCKHSDDEFYPYTLIVHLNEDDGIKSYPLDNADTIETYSIDSMTRFSELKTGLHTLKLSVQVQGGDRYIEVTRTQFNVLSEDWNRIKQSDFNGSYDAAIKFFKDKEKFLYRYQWVYGRYTIADPEWESRYITAITAYPDGKEWRIHCDALPYYQAALSYLADTNVRVHGSNGDTGILQLYQLIDTYDGSYVSRFTSSLKTISHHAFGTATDINAAMEPNLNDAVNNELIDTEVRTLLSYNGIVTEGDQSYYDYTYSGSYPCTEDLVPQTVVNYLLYELAFYRAGFQWGHYYVSTSDAMHFTLTDNIRILHDDPEGLRKVFAYYN